MTRDAEALAELDLILKLIASEIRHLREAQTMTRLEFVARLPSGVGERTLLAYEKNLRALSMPRFLEICILGLQESPTDVLSRAITRSKLVECQNIRVNLTLLAKDDAPRYRRAQEWAQNKLMDDKKRREAEITPGAMREFAVLMRCTTRNLAMYLTKFRVD